MRVAKCPPTILGNFPATEGPPAGLTKLPRLKLRHRWQSHAHQVLGDLSDVIKKAQSQQLQGLTIYVSDISNYDDPSLSQWHGKLASALTSGPKGAWE